MCFQLLWAKDCYSQAKPTSWELNSLSFKEVAACDWRDWSIWTTREYNYSHFSQNTEVTVTLNRHSQNPLNFKYSVPKILIILDN